MWQPCKTRVRRVNGSHSFLFDGVYSWDLKFVVWRAPCHRVMVARGKLTEHEKRVSALPTSFITQWSTNYIVRKQFQFNEKLNELLS